MAEGIEDESQFNLLRDLGCDEAQGYYFGKPMPAEEFLRWLDDWQNTYATFAVAPPSTGERRLIRVFDRKGVPIRK